MFTVDASYTAFREKDLGTLTVGKFADLIVVPGNFLTCDPKDLITMRPTYTVVGGKIRYQSK
jgi:predicted amidohydrolase YtcJ